MSTASRIRIRGIVQGVGFRPFVFRVAQSLGLAGWVLNGEEGVEIHAEGERAVVDEFVKLLKSEAPPAAQVVSVEILPAEREGFSGFTIKESERKDRPTVRISPDLPVCQDCLRELEQAGDRRFQYPYINCTNCGPRYTVFWGFRTTVRTPP